MSSSSPLPSSSNSSLPLCTWNVTQQVQIRILSKEGIAGQAPKTVLQVFDATVETHGSRPALFQKRYNNKDKKDDVGWTVWTWQEYRHQVDLFAKALIRIGLQRFDIINIIGFNSPEWFIGNLGAIAAGGVSAGIYATNLPEACKYISSHSQAKIVLCDGRKQLEKYYDIAADLKPHLKALVMYGTDALPENIQERCPHVPVYTFEQFIELGKSTAATSTTTNSSDGDVAVVVVTDQQLTERSNAWKPGETCSMIYTSGTTGPPKAVMITNDNITWTVDNMCRTTPRGYMNCDDCMVSYLPLSHIAAQMIDLYMPIATGTQVYFADPDALKGSLGATLKQVRPTAFFGVPRVYEKIYDKLQQVGSQTKGLKRVLATWAKAQAAAYWSSREFGSNTAGPRLYGLAKKLLHKVHQALGLDRANILYVSAAPMEVKILKYFASLDLPIMELFGQSECTGPHAINCHDAFKIGTVGRPMVGTETKIDAVTGELCYRGRHIFAGYLASEEATKSTIDADGWLHSGDIAKLDDDNDPRIPHPSGFVSITGRIKELIITAGGENVPPVLIEDELKAAMPALSNCMVIGDKRKFLTVLLCLQVEIDDDGVATNRLANRALAVGNDLGSTAQTTSEVEQDEKWKAYFDDGVKQANDKAASNAQRVGKWALLPTDFTEKGGELTPTLKLKRSVTAEKYATVIEALYT